MGHTIITGPGKSGGSLLMCILTELGLETGFPKGLRGDVGGRYEWPLRGGKLKEPIPKIIKEPQMCADIDLRIEKLGLSVDHIFILLRRPGPMAAALEFLRKGRRRTSDEKQFEWRILNEGAGVRWGDRGIVANDLNKVEGALARRVVQISHLVAEMDIPHTFISYPRYAADHEYAYTKLEPLLEANYIDFPTYKKVASECIDPKQVEAAYRDMPEWSRAMMREAYHWRKRI